MTDDPAAEIAKLKAIVAEQRERLRPDMREVFLFEAAEAGVKAELTMLRELYEAVAGDNVNIFAVHEFGCPWYTHKGTCNCGRDERQARIDKALAAIAEALEDENAG